jgi:hypothetical protein
MHAPRELSRCYGAILGNDDYIVQSLDPKKTPFPISDQGADYVAHIIKTPEKKRVGVVCTLVEGDVVEKQEERQAILKELAAEAEDQLRVRKVLLDRNKVLTEQIQQLKISKEIEVLPSHGPVRAITQEDIDRRESWFPLPEELAKRETPRKSSTLPLVQEVQATPEEMGHLPDDFYALADSMGADHPPIGKDDMERVAVLESLGLNELMHDHPTGIALKRLVVSSHEFIRNWALVVLLTLSLPTCCCRLWVHVCSMWLGQKLASKITPTTTHSRDTRIVPRSKGR